MSLGERVVGPCDDAGQSVVEGSRGGEKIERNKLVEESQGTERLRCGEDQGTKGRDGAARDGSVAGSLDLGVQRSVNEVVPDVNGVGNKDASSQK